MKHGRRGMIKRTGGQGTCSCRLWQSTTWRRRGDASKPTRGAPASMDARCSKRGKTSRPNGPTSGAACSRAPAGPVRYAAWALPSRAEGDAGAGNPHRGGHDPAGPVAGAATAHRSDLQRAQLRLSAGTQRASGGPSGQAVRGARPACGGGRGPGEILRPREPRHPDGSTGEAHCRQGGAAADPSLPERWHHGQRG